ncbi:unnamed protein product [Acanthoscelides obtectus]|uniref:Carboxylic ester hydrolase n=1 Tax=Acanthoscelides obtectus TaxID=200917 RepID=A0A9P0JHU7_ACAOB|nr:unnamed protein product [Acanthoscelides obtectus]CAK1678476.1 hypothetical protein AOBTE_LOCUS31926 [Acanthoscelides obtectus]
MYRFSVVLLSILQVGAVTFLPKREYNISLQVKTTNGIVQGRKMATENGKRYFAFRGIPFARPPLEDLRFRSPQPPEEWKQVVDATKDVVSCMEVQTRSTRVQIVGSEDCLYLNVYTPVEEQGSLPVFFYIYGGGFYEGTSSDEIYGPGHFIDQNAILVIANYRLGLFGFLSTEDLASPGNYGLKDQHLALLWVKSNIRYFGGNPQKVVIIGQSAGANSVMHHVISPKSKGLFSAAVPLSGDTLVEWGNQRSPKSIAQDVAITLGIPYQNTTKFVETLRRLPSKKLQKANLEVTLVRLTSMLMDGYAFTPTIEVDHKDAFITDLTYNSLENGNFAKVPIIMGMTSLETVFFAVLTGPVRFLLLLYDLSPPMLLARLNTMNQRQKYEIAKMIKKAYFQGDFLASASKENITQYLTDKMFLRPLMKTSRLLSKYTNVFFYVYDYTIPVAKEYYKNLGYLIDTEIKGAGHCEDLACYFTSKYLPKDPILTDLEMKHCGKMRKFLMNLALFGNPTPQKDNELQNLLWTPVKNPRELNYLHIAENYTIKQNYRGEFVRLWDNIFETYVKKPYKTY